MYSLTPVNGSCYYLPQLPRRKRLSTLSWSRVPLMSLHKIVPKPVEVKHKDVDNLISANNLPDNPIKRRYSRDELPRVPEWMRKN